MSDRYQVGCERPDGTLNVHKASETCEVCAPTAPSVDAVLQEVERRLERTLFGKRQRLRVVARMLVAAARCERVDRTGYHPAEGCPECDGTGIDPMRLEAALKAGGGIMR